MADELERLRRERDAAVIALQSWQRRYEFLFSNMLTGYAYHDMVLDDASEPIDYIFVEVNKTFEELTGLKAEDITGKRVTEALPGIENAEFDWIGAYGRVAMHGERMHFDQFSEELQRWFQVTAYSPHHGSFVAVFHDITDRKKTEAQLAEKELQLQQSQKLEVIGRLAGSIAHDFNNALTAVLGHAELIVATDDLEQIRHRAATVVDTARRAAAMTQRLLAFGRRQATNPLSIDVADALAATVDLLEPLLGERIDLDLQLTVEPAAVVIDPSELQQIIMNLLINGADSMASAGRLTLQSAVLELVVPPVDVRAGQVGPGRWVELTVIDRGCGMDEATLGRMFEPFFTTKEDRGTGLGLPTVAEIVEAAGGAVTVRSQVGAGTEVRVLLPWHEPRAIDELTQSLTMVPAPEGGRSVLLVEDQQLIRELVEGVLTRAGYRVTALSSGEAALEADLGALDGLVTDVVLPGISGPELAEQLADRYEGLRIVFTSGYSRDELGDIGEDMRFLHKPFSPSQMLTTLADLLA